MPIHATGLPLGQHSATLPLNCHCHHSSATRETGLSSWDPVPIVQLQFLIVANRSLASIEASVRLADLEMNS